MLVVVLFVLEGFVDKIKKEKENYFSDFLLLYSFFFQYNSPKCTVLNQTFFIYLKNMVSEPLTLFFTLIYGGHAILSKDHWQISFELYSDFVGVGSICALVLSYNSTEQLKHSVLYHTIAEKLICWCYQLTSFEYVELGCENRLIFNLGNCGSCYAISLNFPSKICLCSIAYSFTIECSQGIYIFFLEDTV